MVAWRTNLELGAARERVRVARALGTLPVLSEALGRGDLSYAKVRALTRVATPETESRLLAVGGAGPAAQVERIVRSWRRLDRRGERQEAARVHESRGLRVSQRLACDASCVVMYHDAAGQIVDVGARTRTIPPALRRALLHRDHTCRFPGCHARVGEGHHIRRWAQGGPTTLSNLALLCRRHHRAVHEQGYDIQRAVDGMLHVRRPDGRPIPPVPSPPAVPADPVEALRSDHVAEGVHVHTRTGLSGWLGERLDVGWAMDVLRPRPGSA